LDSAGIPREGGEPASEAGKGPSGCKRMAGLDLLLWHGKCYYLLFVWLA